ncbi:MAG: response regulator, partial [Balneolales bacterium]|nr:response regulator [Balneolales bacterium]
IVVSALSGETAIDIINTHPPFDLILLGINLGKGMNGIELCSVIRSNKKYHNTPIIAITALDFDKIYDKVNNAMFTAYIPKPYKITDLLSIQSRYLEVG